MDDSTQFVSKRFTVERVTYDVAGRTQSRDVVRHPGAVTILPLVDAQTICLIRNYRPAVAETLIELPAGTLEVGEDPALCARRELAEETGYQAGRIDPLGSFYLSPGILDEQMHQFLATELQAGEPRREADEAIENFVVPLAHALAMIEDGTIHDAKTIVGLLRYHGRRNG